MNDREVIYIRTLNDKVAFAGQLLPSMMAEIARQGFSQIICNRPDNEENSQATMDDIQTAAEHYGISFTRAPINHADFSLSSIVVSKEALEKNQKTLLFCRSGMRSSVVWAVVQIYQGMRSAEVIQQLASIGYDIAHLENMMISIAARLPK